MIGAIVGDVIGSVYEFHNKKTKNVDLFTSLMHPTDDSIMTIAVMDTLLMYETLNFHDLEPFKADLIKNMVKWYNRYPKAGYGRMFASWLLGDNAYKPYGSFGNGSAMRISPVAYVSHSLEEVKALSKAVSEISHNHPFGIKGAEAIASIIYLTKNGKNKLYIDDYICKHYYPNLSLIKYEDLLRNYRFDSTCEGSVPQAIYCFLISKDFEDCLRTSISIGGDTDTICAMSSSIAEAYYKGVPQDIELEVRKHLPSDILEVIDRFNERFCK